MTNPESKIIQTATTRDGVTAFLHEDGTVSNRLTTDFFDMQRIEKRKSLATGMEPEPRLRRIAG